MRKEVVILINALIWGFVLVACSMAVKNTGAFQDIQLILGGGAVMSLLLVATAGMKKSLK